MSTDRVRSEQGFTLIEVVVATVILAVGLLSLEALGITAARQVKFAEKRSEYAVHASHHLEAGLDSMRREVPLQCAPTLLKTYGTENDSVAVTREVTPIPLGYRVTVFADPKVATGLIRPGRYTIFSEIFTPSGSTYAPC